MPFSGTRWSVSSCSPSAVPIPWVGSVTVTVSLDYPITEQSDSIGIRRFIQDLEKDAAVYEQRRFGSSASASGQLCY